MFLSNQWTIEETKEAIKNYLYEKQLHFNLKSLKKISQRQMTMKTKQSKTYGTQQKQFYEGILQQYNLKSGSKKNLKKNLNLTSKATRKRTDKTQHQ